MADRAARVAFIADVTQFNSNMDKAAGKATSFGKNLESASRKATVVLAGLAGAAISAAKAAVEDEAASQKLANTLKNVTGATSKQTKAVEDYITKTTLATGVTDNDLRTSLQALTVATKDVTKAQELQALALDISAATGKDLNTVTASLVRAQNGSVSSLKKLGVPLSENIIETNNFNKATKELAKTFKGSSAAAAETNAGKMKRLTVSLAEAQEELGAALLPAVTAIVEELAKLAPWISKNKDLILKIALVVGALSAAIVTLNAGYKAYLAITKAWQALTKISIALQTAWNTVMALNPIGLIVIAVIALIAVFVLLYNKSEKVRDIVNTAFTKIKEVIAGVWEWLKDTFSKVFDVLIAPFKLWWKAVSTIWSKIFDFFKNFGPIIGDKVAGVKDLLISPFKLAFNAIADLWNNTLGKFKFELPSWIPGIGGKGFQFPKIPKLAKGGIVTSPTLALIGEAGPEAVVPLNRGYSGQTVINVNGALLDPEGTARAIMKALNASNKRAGAY